MERTDLKSTIRNSILILLFEFIGTTFLTLLFLCNSNVRYSNQYYQKPSINNKYTLVFIPGCLFENTVLYTLLLIKYGFLINYRTSVVSYSGSSFS